MFSGKYFQVARDPENSSYLGDVDRRENCVRKSKKEFLAICLGGILFRMHSFYDQKCVMTTGSFL